MPSRLPCAAFAALLATPAAFAATTTLTIYHADNSALFSGSAQGTIDAGHALVHESRTLDVHPGERQLRIDGLPVTLDPETVTVTFPAGPGLTILGQRVAVANTSANGALDAALGSRVSVVTGGASGEPTAGTITGTLVGASENGVLVRMPDGKVRLVHRYTSMTLPESAVTGGSSLLLDLDGKAEGTRNLRLTYMTSGLGWRAAYSATLANGGSCRMRFKPDASIANRSGRNYRDATIQLVAGQPNLGNGGVRMFSMAAGVEPAAAAGRPMPEQESIGDYRRFTLPGKMSLPNGTVTLAPLYPVREIDCTREYIVEDGAAGFPPKPNTNDYGAQNYRDQPIPSTLAFVAPDALPAGTLRAWTSATSGASSLIGEGAIPDTPRGQQVSVQLGQSFDLRASRERTAFHVDTRAHTMSESYAITLANGGDAARTVTLHEHPNRWREWTVTASSRKPSRQTPQLLAFEVPVPAHGKASLTYTVRYAWTAQDP